MAKLKHWWEHGSASWNRIDAINLTFSLIAFILRVASTSRRVHSIARTLMIVNLIVYFLRLFETFFINSYLGPKVIMITRMVRTDREFIDLIVFTDERSTHVLLLLFRLSYRVQCEQSESTRYESRPIYRHHLEYTTQRFVGDFW